MSPDELGRWEPFDVDTVAALLAGCPARWWLSGGVALDRWLGRTTRAHGDIDVSVALDDWPAVEDHLAPTLDVLVASAGRLLRPAEVAPGEPAHNRWARLRTDDGGAWRLQLNLEPVDDGQWRYRRDPRVTRPFREIMLDVDGVPTVNPAVQLLWKAAAPRRVDDADLVAVLPALAERERHWLVEAVAVAHPTSPWRARLC